MGVAWLVFLLLYVFGVLILALLVVGLVPSFRAISNFFIFVAGGIGGTFGMILLLNILLRTFDFDPFKGVSLSKANDVTVVLIFCSALVGGTTLVWLKVRLLGRRRNRDGD
jgi:hypothetical protein